MFNFMNDTLGSSHNSNNDFQPAESDRELMENVLMRLMAFIGLEHPVGTIFRSIPGAVVRYLPLAGMSVPTVFAAEDERPIGSITMDGQIVYVQPRT